MTTVPESYLSVAKKTPELFKAIQRAGVPEKFTIEFLGTLGFKSTSDRPAVAVLKAIDFLDQTGRPTQNYLDYRNPDKGPKVLARCLRKAYSGLFLVDQNANQLSFEKLKGHFASITGKSDSVIEKMASTFSALTKLADFSEPEVPLTAELPAENIQAPKHYEKSLIKPEFRYNIQIHLPSTRDISVYNAIFKSIREHLLE